MEDCLPFPAYDLCPHWMAHHVLKEAARASEDPFLAGITERLAGLDHVEAVALGGSRAAGRARPDSDWDLAIYYRGPFSPESLRALGWEGKVSGLGGWGGGVFNGGAWLVVDGRSVDIHYRDLDTVDQELDDLAGEGRAVARWRMVTPNEVVTH